MIEKLKNFFRNDTPQSFGRLLSASFGATAIYIAFVEVNYRFWNPDFIIDTALIIELALIAVGGKVWQKYAERDKK